MRFTTLFIALAMASCIANESSECEPLDVESPSGHHNEGRSCIEGGCHDGGTPQAPQWTAAGTLFRDRAGSSPLAGGTIELVDAQGVTVTLVSAQNGNFWTAQPLVFPLTSKASGCSESRTMPTPTPLGSCNGAGCHATKRIHLP
ncbi:MAG: hypothetical protein HOV81_11865, partial [Kofleriaceae bacterium]|nr:hypothetical protein [Kofleriaceae bacterium]